uniref:RNA methyltransferase n=1 Tax=Leptobrachium leishanense TaxID=445787 RepID=A0A8C5LP69_9ANUR
MQVLVEMSSPETMQPPVTVKESAEATFLVPLVNQPLRPEAQTRAVKEGSEQLPVPRAHRNGFQGKRRNSFNIGFKHPAPFKRRRRVNSDCDPVLPSKFLLGGNIFDPLNLNSLLDEEVNRALNAETPKSSPLPSRNRDPVEILIPKDITDPLSLNAASGDVELLLSPMKSGRKRHRHRHHQTSDALAKAASGLEKEAEPTPEELRPYELNTVINCRDEVVPLPALKSEATLLPPAPVPGSRHRKRRRTSSKSEGRQGSPERMKSLVTVPSKIQCPKAQAPSKSKSRFQYGNYCRYYGYRNPSWTEDARLRVLRPEWFRGKSVLDIGCNVGHLTLCVAKNMGASRVVGLDIDVQLVHAAKQNIRHYLSESTKGDSVFPSSFVTTRGPIAAPGFLPKGDEEKKKEFPHNVVFLQGNYVVDRDELVKAQKPEYDVILCLSVTKWVHLNWGDDGLRRMFKRMYRHLNPGGILVLEPQPWSSYGKRKRLTDTIFRNYSKISLKPQDFPSFLLSPEVGFSSYESIATPNTQPKGFQRPMYAFYKSGPAAVTAPEKPPAAPRKLSTATSSTAAAPHKPMATTSSTAAAPHKLSATTSSTAAAPHKPSATTSSTAAAPHKPSAATSSATAVAQNPTAATSSAAQNPTAAAQNPTAATSSAAAAAQNPIAAAQNPSAAGALCELPVASSSTVMPVEPMAVEEDQFGTSAKEPSGVSVTQEGPVVAEPPKTVKQEPLGTAPVQDT